MLDERAEGDPLEGSRIMLAGRAEEAERRRRRRSCAGATSTPIHPRKPLWILRISRSSGSARQAPHLVAGFGRIIDLKPEQFLTEIARCRRAAGGRAGRRRAYERGSSRRDEPLRDQAARRRSRRLALHRLRPRWDRHAGRAQRRCGWIFPERVDRPGELRKMLVKLADEARARL